ncbi:Frataxin -like protein, mitochondrial [Halotydeus destructor]|nr:Frataxin -like protein, mitochondrial [Halotydeus destructor]
MALRVRNYHLGRACMVKYKRAITMSTRPPPVATEVEPPSVRTAYRRFIGFFSSKRNASIDTSATIDGIDANEYEVIAEETLEALSDVFEGAIEKFGVDLESDVALASGVLTVKLGHHGTYVINKQSPNRQIWLSSPVSGPKRYDFMDGRWIYKHDGVSLHDLLTIELSEIFGSEVEFANCIYGSAKT